MLYLRVSGDYPILPELSTITLRHFQHHRSQLFPKERECILLEWKLHLSASLRVLNLLQKHQCVLFTKLLIDRGYQFLLLHQRWFSSLWISDYSVRLPVSSTTCLTPPSLPEVPCGSDNFFINININSFIMLLVLATKISDNRLLNFITGYHLLDTVLFIPPLPTTRFPNHSVVRNIALLHE